MLCPLEEVVAKVQQQVTDPSPQGVGLRMTKLSKKTREPQQPYSFMHCPTFLKLTSIRVILFGRQEKELF